ncbi:hypothetical protein V1477_014546 [Vespula maculifrons]|uniref:Uncharacterized protein n=1 Tax=Vespula maculifrons TaxID=7453 RepID=A0ABD2BHT1_VESMC
MTKIVESANFTRILDPLSTTGCDEKYGGSKLVGMRCSSKNIRSPHSRKLMIERNFFVTDSHNELVRVSNFSKKKKEKKIVTYDSLDLNSNFWKLKAYSGTIIIYLGLKKIKQKIGPVMKTNEEDDSESDLEY